MNGNDMVKPQLILGYPKIPVELDTISLKLPASTKEAAKVICLAMEYAGN